LFACDCKLQLSKQLKLKQPWQLGRAEMWHFRKTARWSRVMLCGNTAHHRDIQITTHKGMQRFSEGMGWF